MAWFLDVPPPGDVKYTWRWTALLLDAAKLRRLQPSPPPLLVGGARAP